MTARLDPKQIRHLQPKDRDFLWNWVYLFTGVRIARSKVCCDHTPPFDAFACWQLDRPSSALCLGARGSGKAQPMSSHVQTPTGPKLMGRIRAGDRVCTPDGGITTVVAVHPQGRKPCYRVWFRDGSLVECCEDHLWEVDCPGKRWSGPKVVGTKYLLANFKRGDRGDRIFHVRLPEPLLMDYPEGLWLIDPYVMGVLLGDGCFRGSSLTFTSADPEIVERVRFKLSCGLVVSQRNELTYGIVQSGNWTHVPNAYVSELKNHGLWGAKSKTKFIPRNYLYATIESRWSLLQGLMDTDGTVDGYDGTIEYYTISWRLAQDVKWLIESLGGICSFREKKTTHQLCYRLNIKFADPSKVFSLTRKKERCRPRTKYIPKRVIVDIEPIGDEVCQCITVTDPRGLYMTDNCVVTHNSFLSALDLYMDSRFNPGHQSRILGGAKSQAKQIHQGISESVIKCAPPFGENWRDADQIETFGVEAVTFHNGSRVEILTASETSVRGPHVPHLRMDEVDEIDRELQQSALGMCMDKTVGGRRYTGKLVRTSTWHNVGGPMEELISRARETPGYPFHAFCTFDVLERCDEERSGPYVGGSDLYVRCPDCALVKWCHAERDRNGGIPLAKLADGHYAIDAFIQKTTEASARVFESDYLCKGAKAAGLWFTTFDVNAHVTESAEYNPLLPVHLALDTGARTGGVWFQVEKRPGPMPGYSYYHANFFGDYFGEFLTPEVHVKGRKGVSGYNDHAGIKEIAERLCNGRMDYRWTDPVGNAQGATGTVVIGEYAAAGLPLTNWPTVPIKDALTLVEQLLLSADGTVRIHIHPRCQHIIRAFQSFRRGVKDGVLLDLPEEGQHPASEFVDAVKNGLVAVIGREGHRPTPTFSRMPARRVF